MSVRRLLESLNRIVEEDDKEELAFEKVGGRDLRATKRGNAITFSGGPHGNHRITVDARTDWKAHWKGYVAGAKSKSSDVVAETKTLLNKVLRGGFSGQTMEALAEVERKIRGISITMGPGTYQYKDADGFQLLITTALSADKLFQQAAGHGMRWRVTFLRGLEQNGKLDYTPFDHQNVQKLEDAFDAVRAFAKASHAKLIDVEVTTSPG